MRLLTASRPLPAAASAALLTGLVLLGPATTAGAAPARPATTTVSTSAPRSSTTVKATTGSGTKKTGSGATSPTTTATPTTSVKPSSRTSTPTSSVKSSTTPSTTAKPAGTKATSSARSATGAGTAGSAPSTTAAAPTTVKPAEVAIDPAERPALLVDGPTSPAPTSALDLSPLTKLWLAAGGLAALALVLTLLLVSYWRRTRPVGRPVMVASAGAISPATTRRRTRRHRTGDELIELDEDVEGVRILGSAESIGRATNAVIDRRTAAAVSSPARWTGEVKVTTGTRVTGTLVPLAAAPDNLDTDDAAGGPGRWTGDRWSGNDPKLRTRV